MKLGLKSYSFTPKLGLHFPTIAVASSQGRVQVTSPQLIIFLFQVCEEDGQVLEHQKSRKIGQVSSKGPPSQLMTLTEPN